jgi:hypothetical protein
MTFVQTRPTFEFRFINLSVKIIVSKMYSFFFWCEHLLSYVFFNYIILTWELDINLGW